MQNEFSQSDINIDEMLDAAWGDDLTDAEEFDTPAEEADQQTEPEAEEQQDEATGEASADEGQDTDPKEPEPEVFTLRYMQEDKQYSREEVIKNAQKGLDYDRIRTERDALKAETPLLKEYKGFLEELAADSNTTVEKLIEDIRTNRLVQREAKAGRAITELAAREQIQREKASRNKDYSAEGTAEQAARTSPHDEAEPQSASAAPNPDVLNFCKAYPNVQPGDIPQEVWDDVRRGTDLTSAYTRYENKQLRSQLEALKLNDKNKNRSTGSRQSSGGSSAKSDYDKAWDDADF